jgi:hypothetical protein
MHFLAFDFVSLKSLVIHLNLKDNLIIIEIGLYGSFGVESTHQNDIDIN